MAQAGWGVELFVGAAETEFEDEALRGGVGRVVTGEEGLRACVFEGKFYDGAGRFLGESAAPIGAAEMNAQLEDGVFRAIGTEAGATGVLVRIKKENRPVLDIVSGAEIYFCVQPFLGFFRREWAADEARDFRVSPEGQSEREISAGPMTKAEAGRCQEIMVHVESNRVTGEL